MKKNSLSSWLSVPRFADDFWIIKKACEMGSLCFFSTLCLLHTACFNSAPTSVLVLPTIHGAHEKNSEYTYEHLFDIIKAFDPESIGIEIRPEDMEQDDDYLDPFYPTEMMMLKNSFPEKVKDLDFYGEATRDRLLSLDMLKDTTHELRKIIYMQRKMNSDSVLIGKEQELGLPEILEEQKRIATTYSGNRLMNGEYDSLTSRYYRVLDSLLKNTHYESYSTFHTNRDVEIARNALDLVRKIGERK